jgi:TetR/AcrR family fatty acid metabolism transcriptional regulator
MASPIQKSHTRSTKSRGTGSRQKSTTFIEEARRKQILDASVVLFGKSGYDRTSLAEIADMVGISRGVISYHFDGKRDLGEEVIRYGIRQFGQYVQNRVSQQNSGKLKLLEFVSASLDYIEEHPDNYLVYTDTLRCFGTREEKAAMVAWANERTREILTQIIKEGQSDGSIGSVPISNLADIVQSVIDGLMEQVAVQPKVVDLPGCKRLIRKMLLPVIKS